MSMFENILQDPRYDYIKSEIADTDKCIQELAPHLTYPWTKRIFHIEKIIEDRQRYRIQLEEELQNLAEHYGLELE